MRKGDMQNTLEGLRRTCIIHSSARDKLSLSRHQNTEISRPIDVICNGNLASNRRDMQQNFSVQSMLYEDTKLGYVYHVHLLSNTAYCWKTCITHSSVAVAPPSNGSLASNRRHMQQNFSVQSTLYDPC